MDEFIARVYDFAPRFSEGELFRSQEYEDIKERLAETRRRLVATFGDTLVPLLDEYIHALSEERELETLHFFQEGFLAGQELRQ